MSNNAGIGRNAKLITYLSVLATSGLIIISLFLPFGGYSYGGLSDTFSLWKKGDGYFFLFIVIAGLIFLLLGKILAVIVSGVVTLGLFFIEYADLPPRVNGKVVEALDLIVDKKIGFYLLLIGALGLIAAGVAGIVLQRISKK